MKKLSFWFGFVALCTVDAPCTEAFIGRYPMLFSFSFNLSLSSKGSAWNRREAANPRSIMLCGTPWFKAYRKPTSSHAWRSFSASNSSAPGSPAKYGPKSMMGISSDTAEVSLTAYCLNRCIDPSGNAEHGCKPLDGLPGRAFPDGQQGRLYQAGR